MPVPTYGNRQGWKPRTANDYDDGGAFPEIHLPQFPLGMGEKKTSSSIIPLNIDSEGKINFGAVLGIHDKKVVYSSARDLIEREPDEDDLVRPGEEEEMETTALTQEALSKNIQTKIAAAVPAKPAQKQAEATYFRYTPEGQNKQQRVIKLVEKPVDPFEPPKFKHKKVVRGPGSPPVPIVHSPPRKLTQKDFEEWKIPPCISNWKNQRGLTIALDKRLAADGRGLQKPQINDKFAQLAESLYLAERNARTMVEQRAEINKLSAEKVRREKEEQLAEMAARARNARTNNFGESEEDAARAERDKLREERRKQTEREMRLENLKGKKKREGDRDISERIALGQAQPTLTGEAMFDQRLFNQSQGLSQGFGGEDTYNVFDKPLFRGSSANQLFRPKKAGEDSYGSEADLDALKNSSKFEEERKPNSSEEKKEVSNTDDFDFLDDFMDEAKTAKMDDVLSKSMMSAPRRSNVQPATRKRSESPIDNDSSPGPQRRGRRQDSRSPSPRNRRRRASPSPRRGGNKRHDSRSPSPRRNRRYNRDSRSPSPRRGGNRRYDSRSPSPRYRRRSPYDRRGRR